MSTDFRPALRCALQRECNYDFIGVRGETRGPTKFRGITGDAAKLGVNRVTLYRALRGDWHLPKLLRRYHQLKRGAK